MRPGPVRGTEPFSPAHRTNAQRPRREAGGGADGLRARGSEPPSRQFGPRAVISRLSTSYDQPATKGGLTMPKPQPIPEPLPPPPQDHPQDEPE